MGVHGLWSILAPVGRRLDLATLQGKVLAIDVSIWLTQFVKAMRDDTGKMVANAHIVGSLRRICKLLFYKIKPIFVFDGGVPILKRRIMEARRQRKGTQEANLSRTAQKILLNSLLQHQLKDAQLKKTGNTKRTKEPTAIVPGFNMPSAAAAAASTSVATSASAQTSPSQDTSHDQNIEPADKSGVRNVTFQVESDQESDVSFSDQEGIFDPEEGAHESYDRDIAGNFDDIDVNVPKRGGEVDLEAVAALPERMQYQVIAKLKDKNRARDSKSQFYLPVAGDPLKYSGVQLDHFLKDSILKKKLLAMEANLSSQAGDGRKIAAEPNREFFLQRISAEPAYAVEQDEKKIDSPKHKPDQGSSSDDRFVSEHHAIETVPHQQVYTDLGDPSSGESGDESGYVSSDANSVASKTLSIAQVNNLSPNQTNQNTLVQDENRIKPVYRSLSRVSEDSNIVPAKHIEAAKEHKSDVLISKSAQRRDSISSTGSSGMKRSRSRKSNSEPGTTMKGAITADEALQQALSTASHLTSWAGIALRRAMKKAPDVVVDVSIEDATSRNVDVSIEDATNRNVDVSIEDATNRNVGVSKSDNGQCSSGVAQTSEINVVNKNASDIQRAGSKASIPLDEESSMLSAGKFERDQKSNSDSKKLDVAVSGPADPSSIASRLLCSEPSVDTTSTQQCIINAETTGITTLDTKEADTTQDAPNSLVVAAKETSSTQQSAAAVNTSASSSLCESHQTSSSVNDQSGNSSSMKEQSETSVPYRRQHNTKYEETQAASNDIATFNNRKNFNDADSTIAENIRTTTIGEASVVSSPSSSKLVRNPTGNPSASMYTSPSSLDLTSSTQDPEENHEVRVTFVQPNQDTEKASPNKTSGSSSSGPSFIPQNLTQEQMSELQRNAETENIELKQIRNRASRDADSVTPQMQDEVKELLRLFGLPFIESPMEAEAQCAALEQDGIVDGVVTDDCDAFLFGSQAVYKNIFDQRHYVEVYKGKDIVNELGLDREQMICLALLLGSDYTRGIKGVGVVNATEIVRAFHDLGGLKEFGDWIRNYQLDAIEEIKTSNNAKGKGKKKKTKETRSKSEKTEPLSGNQVVEEFKMKHKTARKRWLVNKDFPSSQVVQAYLEPSVAQLEGVRLSWGLPNLAAIRSFCEKKLRWPQSETDSLVLGPIKEYMNRDVQTTLDSFVVSYKDQQRFAAIRSERLQEAVRGLRQDGPVLRNGKRKSTETQLDKRAKLKVVSDEEDAKPLVPLAMNKAGTTKPLEPVVVVDDSGESVVESSSDSE